MHSLILRETHDHKYLLQMRISDMAETNYYTIAKFDDYHLARSIELASMGQISWLFGDPLETKEIQDLKNKYPVLIEAYNNYRTIEAMVFDNQT